MDCGRTNQAAEDINGTVNKVFAKEFDDSHRRSLSDRDAWSITQCDPAASQCFLQCGYNLRFGDSHSNIVNRVIVPKLGELCCQLVGCIIGARANVQPSVVDWNFDVLPIVGRKGSVVVETCGIRGGCTDKNVDAIRNSGKKAALSSVQVDGTH